ncbi:MAG: TraR/DksA C4-type zinc finger protein [Chloroflexi bacterium]|nr:TraR/DksA C4-type zinc finger protein [Chloroflexota bacterium]
MKPLAELLKEAEGLHGKLCPGQVIGVRMAVVGCREIGISEPQQDRRLRVWAEIDRCATDAIQAVTGCKLGRRTLKFFDYGKMAATFLNTEAGRAVRVVARDDARELAGRYAPRVKDKQEAQLAAYLAMPESELFLVHPVAIALSPYDEPGHPLKRVRCQSCGEGVNDDREVYQDGRTLCRPCALGGYYRLLGPGEEAAASTEEGPAQRGVLRDE